MKVIVTGIGGQDGFYLANYLLDLGAQVVGITSQSEAVGRLGGMFPTPQFSVEALDFSCRGAVEPIILRHRPDMFFNLAAMATGSGMFADPARMSRINGEFVLDVLEVARASLPHLRICQASSAEMFGNAKTDAQTEETCFRPLSPYGAAKAYAHNLISIYRTAYGLHCSTAILFNHESPRRPVGFVTRKIARAAAEIKLGLREGLTLGNLETKRDWGYAPEYVEAMFLIASNPKASDYVVSTGVHSTIRELCELAFGHVGLDYRSYVAVDTQLVRSIETKALKGRPDRIFRDLGWRAKTPIAEVIREMVDCDMQQLLGNGLDTKSLKLNYRAE
jgi:GDPmannose 4,6-dehydratase